MKRPILAALSLPAFYLVGAFIAWDFNAGNWDIFARGMMAFVAIWAAIGLLILE